MVCKAWPVWRVWRSRFLDVLRPTALSVLSCLFVFFGRQHAFSLYYFGCGMEEAFCQNPSVRKTLLSFVWWKPSENLVNSPGFDIHHVFTMFWKFTRFSPAFGTSPNWTGFHRKTYKFQQKTEKFLLVAILKEAFFWQHLKGKMQEAFLYSLLKTQNASLERWWIPGKPSGSNLTIEWGDC